MTIDKLGLRQGQMRSPRHVHNGSWFDRDGIKIGWGDLSKEDLFRIAAALPEDDVFYIVGEHDSYRNVGPEGLALDEVKQLSRFIITTNRVTVTKKWLSRLDGNKTFDTLEEYERELAPWVIPRDIVITKIAP